MASLPQPVKLYYLAPIFRYERPQAGRFRQHHQFGCEAIGESSPALDAEVIGLALHFYRSLGLVNLQLHLNSIGCRQCRPGYHEKLKTYYTDKVAGLCPDCRTRFEKNPLRLLDCKEPACQAAAEAAPSTAQSLCTDCLNHHKALQMYLLDLGLNYQLDKRLVRGLDYYNRTVFEIQSPDIGAQAAIGGGGRYDNLIEDLGGKPTPAIGFGSGIERIIAALQAAKVEPPPYPPPAAFIAWTGDNAVHAALRLSGKLRKQGFAVILGLGGKSLKAQFRQADSAGARWTIILGDNELASGNATVKNMATGEQESVPMDQLESLPGAEPAAPPETPPPPEQPPAA
jgi:histidyl-tRNA synthetase